MSGVLGLIAAGLAVRWLADPVAGGTPLRAVGFIEATEIDVASRIPGRLVSVSPEEGDWGSRDQVVSRIDSTDLTHELPKSSGDLSRVRAELEDAQRSFVRTQQVFDEYVASSEARDAAVTRVETARAAVESAQAQVAYYEDQLRDTEIRTPIEGRVTYKALEVGEWVTPGAPPILTVSPSATFPSSGRASIYPRRRSADTNRCPRPSDPPDGQAHRDGRAHRDDQSRSHIRHGARRDPRSPRHPYVLGRGSARGRYDARQTGDDCHRLVRSERPHGS